MMRLLAWVFGALALACFAFLGVGLLMPATWSAEQTAELAAPPERVFSFLESAEAWGGWTPWPEEGTELAGPDAGPGSARSWDHPEMGSGRFEIRDAEPPERVAYTVELQDGRYRVAGVIELEPSGDGTRVLWREEGDFGRNPILAYTARRMDRLHGEQMLRSLERLEERLRVSDARPDSAR